MTLFGRTRLSFIAAAGAAMLLGTTALAATSPPAAVVQSEGIRLGPARPIATQVASQPGPIHIDGCFSDGRGIEGLTIVHHAMRITNQGDRAINAVRVRFDFYDAFGDIHSTRTNIAEARLEAGQTADRVNLSELSEAGPPARITCSVDAVRYSDGTIVRAGVAPPPQR
jgi:hypothetical protein